MNFNSACSELKKIREDGLRDSERVVELWEAYVCKNFYRLGDERWTICEQVFVSALDSGFSKVASACLKLLSNQFPGSTRIKRYRAMQEECAGRFEQAELTYKRLVEDDPLDAQSRKRLIALHKARGRGAEAVKELVGYLQRFCTDFEAWLELSELYLAEGDYKKAAFCLEELILSNPHNHLYHQRYAEIKYTEGGQESMELSKSYFAQAVKLNPNNMRALYGLLLSASNCATHAKSNARVKRECGQLAQWAADQIADRQRAAGVARDATGGDDSTGLSGLVGNLALGPPQM